ncbi:MAG: FtsX-like permease family protein, partial [Candidatus Bathyarchaeia archaeon]
YASGQTQFSDMQITIEQKIEEGEVNGTEKEIAIIEVNCWLLKGKLISISDCDPVTGEKPVIRVTLAASVPDGVKKEAYKSLYFVPIGYELTIRYIPKTKGGYIYPPLKILVDETLSSVNWMYHAAKSYGNYRMNSVGREIEWLGSAGLSVSRESEEKMALEKLLNRILDLYKKEDYSAAFSGMRIFLNRMDNLERWLSNLKALSMMSTICISLFTFALSSILAGFIFEEPAKNKERAIVKAVLFTSLLIFFFLIDPSSKVACALLVERTLSSPLLQINAPTVILGLFVIGALIYFLATLLSVKRSPVTDLSLQLGVRSLKRRPLRTTLTLITAIIIVSASMTFVNISIARETKIGGSWPGTNISGLRIYSEGLTGLSIHDITWIREQEMCEKIGYIEKIKTLEMLGEGQISRIAFLNIGGEKSHVINLVCVDPDFMEKYYNFSKYVRGFWREFSEGEKVALLPVKYDVAIGEYVTLSVDEKLMVGMGVIDLGTRTLGRFKVVGKFDYAQISLLKGIDNNPLLDDVSNTVLLPIKSVNDTSLFISEATVITRAGFDPVDVAKELAYLLGFPIVANKNGLSVLVRWTLEVSIAGFLPYIIPLAVASLMMYITMSSVYEERKRELFTLATLGLDPRNMLLAFLVEALLIGLIGTFVGFFGTYIISTALLALSSLLKVETAFYYVSWSPLSFFAALFIGVVTVFLGGYIPSIRAQGLSLMGRAKTRELAGELIIEGENAIFQLPIRETLQNSELLYEYSKETLRKISLRLVDPHSIKGEIYGDGTFSISFMALGSGQSVFIPCVLKGERSEDILTLSVVFPKSYREYEQINRILRDLEAYIIGFSSWRDMQLKMRIIRETPKKQKTMDEILDEIKALIKEIKDLNRKLGILESQKGRLTEELYNEFRQKYLNMINEKFKALRSISVGLEPYMSQIQEEIRRTSLEIERTTIAYNLGEISEEEYIKTCSPLQNNLVALKNKLSEVEEVMEFLRKPLGIP